MEQNKSDDLFQETCCSLRPGQRLMELVNLRYLSQAICLSNKQGLANVVTKQTAVHINEVAKRLSCRETNLYRLMSYLASYGIFEEKDDHFFIGNEMSEVMRGEDALDSCHNLLLSHGMQEYWESTVNMESVLDKYNEKTPFEIIFGEPFYEYLEHHTEKQCIFDLGVANNTMVWQSNIPSYYDFSRYGSVADLAGGIGGLLKAVLLNYSNIQGTLFEKPVVLEHVLKELFTDERLKDRFHAVCGNFFEKIELTADLFMVARTLHCFEDARLSIILKNIAEAMRRKTGSRLLIIETDYEKAFKSNVPSDGRHADIRMMLVSGGRERSLDTWRALLAVHGLVVLQKIPFPSTFMGLECQLA